LLGPAAVGAAAVPLFGAFAAPVFLVLARFFDLLREGFPARFAFAPEVVCLRCTATPGRGGGATLGFGAFEPVLPDEPLWPEAPVEPAEPEPGDEPVVPDEPVVLDEPVLVDEPVEAP
jgi:hypothetical protein